MIDPLHFLIGFLYGSVTLAAWTVVLWRALIAVPRSVPRVLAAVATEIVAAMLVIALAAAVILDLGLNEKWFLVGLVAGGFTGAGVVTALGER